VAIGTQNNGADVKLFAGAVNRLVGSDVCQITFGAAGIAGDLLRPNRTGRLAGKNEPGDEETANNDDDGGSLKQVIELREAGTLPV
jgi:hypothetical protein